MTLCTWVVTAIILSTSAQRDTCAPTVTFTDRDVLVAKVFSAANRDLAQLQCWRGQRQKQTSFLPDQGHECIGIADRWADDVRLNRTNDDQTVI